MISYAQNFEDVILARALRDVHVGFYIDVGAMDPIYASVTKHFYDLGWHGINIEPDRRYYNRLLLARPRDINLDIAVGAREETRAFYCFDQEGISTFSTTACQHFAALAYDFQVEQRQVTTLAQICRQYVGSDIHFLKIDAEGWESEILSGADWDRFRPFIVLLEARHPGTTTATWDQWEPGLLNSGYIFVYDDGLNRFYLREENKERRIHFQVPPNVFDGFTHHAVIEARSQLDAARHQQSALQAQLADLSATLCQHAAHVQRLQQEKLAAQRLADHLATQIAAERLRSLQLDEQLRTVQKQLHELARQLQAEQHRSQRLEHNSRQQTLWIGHINQQLNAYRLRYGSLTPDP